MRPELVSYTANLVAANTMFIKRLHARLRETQYTYMLLTGEQKVTSSWLRQVSGHNGLKDRSGQPDTQSNRYDHQQGVGLGWLSELTSGRTMSFRGKVWLVTFCLCGLFWLFVYCLVVYLFDG
ncbi:autotransporter outer membrane beta-barrel domain-containing protein [Serratia sp. N21D137]|uniref:autotransporter outer membrane beta-barrel domain-containing protein n=1 Tax=Serratia sp. N21D137 TaxID=3397495 RepID=UPI0039E06A30